MKKPNEQNNKVSVPEMPGSLYLAPQIKPELPHGDYTVEVSMSVNLGKKESYKPQIAMLTQALAVGMQPFTLPEERIYSLYPPKNACGTYEDVLPHIIFNSRSYPWERSLRGDDEHKKPWIALLVFSADEKVQSITVDTKNYTKADYFTPKLDDEYESLLKRDKTCRVVDIPVELFRDVLPCWDELPFLAHVRNVSLDNKVTDPLVKDNWFAAVTANRFPLVPETISGSMRNSAYLVSLEGFEDLLEKEPIHRDFSGCHNVRMFCLAEWDFYCEMSSFDFTDITSKIDTDVLAYPPELAPNDKIKPILKAGYCAATHTFREGSRSLSWYRSPFAPYKTKDYDFEPCQYPDKLLRFDAELQMFDVTYSAAWQLGRLLALQDQAYAQALYQWRAENKRNDVKDWSGDIISQTIKMYNKSPSDKKDGFLPTETHFDAEEAPNIDVKRACKEALVSALSDLGSVLGASDPFEILHVAEPQSAYVPLDKQIDVRINDNSDMALQSENGKPTLSREALLDLYNCKLNKSGK